MKNVMIKVIAVVFGVLSILSLLFKVYSIIKLANCYRKNQETNREYNDDCESSFSIIDGIDDLEEDDYPKRKKKISRAELRKKKKELEKTNNEILEITNEILNPPFNENISISELHEFMCNKAGLINKEIKEKCGKLYLRRSEILSDIHNLLHFRLNDKKTDFQCKNEENSLIDVSSCSVESIPKDLALSRTLKTPDSAGEISPFGSHSGSSTE